MFLAQSATHNPLDIRDCVIHNHEMTPLKKARLAAQQTLKAIADCVEIDVSHLSRVERGMLQASPALAEKLANHFKRTISEEMILYPQRFPDRRAAKVGSRV